MILTEHSEDRRCERRREKGRSGRGGEELSKFLGKNEKGKKGVGEEESEDENIYFWL